MKYNLDVLSPLEFEKLSRDFISKKLSMEFKIFKPRRDSGIDLRNKENGIICQCKHIQKFSDLKSNLKKVVEKLPNIKDLKKYYLIVSTKLTPANENVIIEMFEQKYIDFEISNLLKHITTNMDYFVETGIFKECYEKLNVDKLLIISGSPGVGKTINSNLLVAKMIAS